MTYNMKVSNTFILIPRSTELSTNIFSVTHSPEINSLPHLGTSVAMRRSVWAEETQSSATSPDRSASGSAAQDMCEGRSARAGRSETWSRPVSLQVTRCRRAEDAVLWLRGLHQDGAEQRPRWWRSCTARWRPRRRRIGRKAMWDLCEALSRVIW